MMDVVVDGGGVDDDSGGGDGDDDGVDDDGDDGDGDDYMREYRYTQDCNRVLDLASILIVAILLVVPEVGS